MVWGLNAVQAGCIMHHPCDAREAVVLRAVLLLLAVGAMVQPAAAAAKQRTPTTRNNMLPSLGNIEH